MILNSCQRLIWHLVQLSYGSEIWSQPGNIMKKGLRFTILKNTALIPLSMVRTQGFFAYHIALGLYDILAIQIKHWKESTRHLPWLKVCLTLIAWVLRCDQLLWSISSGQIHMQH